MQKKKKSGILEADMTPMIDMTFQLIAFFMVLINFSQAEQHEKVVLPESTLAKPPETPYESPIVIQVDATGRVYLGGSGMDLEAIKTFLEREKTHLQNRGKSVSDANIIIRAHKSVEAGVVQRLIRKCKDAEFKNFALTAKEKMR